MHWFPRRSKNLEDIGDMVKKTCYFLKEKKTKAIRNSREKFFKYYISSKYSKYVVDSCFELLMEYKERELT